MKATVKTGNKGTLNLREKPSTSAAVITQIPYGTEIDLGKEEDGWYQVTFDRHTGYAMKKYLEVKPGNKDEKIITKSDLQTIYDSLKSTLKLIEGVLK